MALSPNPRASTPAALLPAAILMLVLLAAALLLPLPALGAAWSNLPPRRIMGWLMLTVLAATPTVIAWSAACAPSSRWRLWRGIALFTAVLSILIVLVLWATAAMAPWAGLKIDLVLTAWLAFWMLATRQLARLIGFGPAMATTLSLALLLAAAPVTLMPLFRALPPAARAPAITVAAQACPTLAILDATGTNYSWMQESVMYNLTALGQDMPLTYPAWWSTALLFAVLAAALAGFR